MTRTVLANKLLLKGPRRFDWIQVGRIGRLIEKAHAAPRACYGDARIVMGGKVVHDEHVALAEFGEKNTFHPANKSVFVRGGEHGRECDPAGKSDRSEDGQILPPVHGNSIDKLAASLHPRVRAAHREVHARFIDENELVGGNAPDPAQELPAFFLDVGPHTFQRPAAFFLTTYP